MSEPNVFSAIAAVVAEIEPVTKQKVAGLKYPIIGEAAIMGVVRPLLVKHALTIVPTNVDLLDSSGWETKSGTRMNRTVTRVTYRIAHHPSGSHVDVQTIGEAADAGDKSVAKSLTIAWKYAIRQTFAIETGDDPDRKAIDTVTPGTVKPVVQPTNGASNGQRPVIREIENLISQLDDPNAAIQAIFAKRGIATFDELTDGQAAEVRMKLGDLVGVEFFDKSLTPETAKN